MHVAFQGLIATGRVGVETTARVYREVSGLWYRLDREIAGRLDDHRALAAHPRDDRRPIFVVMPPAGLALLTTTTRPASQVFFSAVSRLPLLAAGVIEFVRFHRPCQLAIRLEGHRAIA